MKTSIRSLASCAAITAALSPFLSWAASPEVSNIRATQRAGTKLVDIYYDVTDPENDPLTVAIQIYDNTTAIPTYSVSGDVGLGVIPGADKHIVWNAGQDWNRRLSTKGKARILVDDLSITSPSASMAFVPGGFGKPTGSTYEIYTSGFYMDKLEVSKTLWDTVKVWATSNGYQFDNVGYAAATNHPVTGISWFDAAKWCNARSQMDGLTPCYYIDAERTQVYKSGQVSLDNNRVSWEANGYRLPTVAEWAKAYRGGQAAGYYPWPSYFGNQEDNMSPSLANYYGRGGSVWKQMLPVGYFDGNQTPIGPDNKNGYGLYDMGGNASEWCWDREFTNWFSGYAEARDDNSKGPNLGQGANRAWAGSFYYSGSSSFSDQYYEIATTTRKPTDLTGGTTWIVVSSIGLRCLRGK